MTCRKSKRHLEFESLEAIELLSAAGMPVAQAGTQHHVAQIHRGTNEAVADVALNLSGSLQGTYQSSAGGSAVGFTGRGTVNPIGKVQSQGRIAFTASGSKGQLTLNFGKPGKIVGSITGLASQGVYLYQITGGTRTLAGDTGVGLAVVNILTSNRAQTRGRFAMSLQPASSS
jgi:hypothetical protein